MKNKLLAVILFMCAFVVSTQPVFSGGGMSRESDPLLQQQVEALERGNDDLKRRINTALAGLHAQIDGGCCGLCKTLAAVSYDDSDLQASYPNVQNWGGDGRNERAQAIKSELTALMGFITSNVSPSFGSLDSYNQYGILIFLRKKFNDI